MSAPKVRSGRPKRRVKWRVASILTMTVVALLIAGAVGAVEAAARGAWLASPFDQVTPDFYLDPGPTAQAPVAGVAVAPPGPLPDAGSLQAAIDAISRAGVGTIGLTVIGADGTVLVDEGATTPLMPASSNKVLTCLTALSYLGADATFTTQVVDADPGIVLVGGGDPYLANVDQWSPEQASAVTLAQQTAAALTAEGRTSVALGYDESLFSGPDFHPTWPGDYSTEVTRLSPLWIDQGFVNGVRNASPGLAAASMFAGLLGQQGITVTSVTATTAPAGAKRVAAVESMPLSLIVHQILLESDNSAAEMVFRHIGLAAGATGSFADAAAAEQAKLTSWGLWDDGMTIVDGSGLSRSDRVTPAALAGAIRQAYLTPALSDVIVGLPVAYCLGTLVNRFNEPGAEAGRGVVRAKTGSLTGVRSLTGYTQTASGGVVMFSLMVEDYTDASAVWWWMDQVATAITVA